MPSQKRDNLSGFTLVELLVVIGIIAILIGLLMPSLQRAHAQANAIKCAANERQIGVMMLQYSQENNGYLYPEGMGGGNPADKKWYTLVFKVNPVPHDPVTDERWTPRVMLCPSDDEHPASYHSYVLNDHIHVAGLKYSSVIPKGHTPAQIILLGEKVSDQTDCYMNIHANGGSDFDRVVAKYRHGISIGSNYLFLDMHVETLRPNDAYNGIDPWDPDVPNSQTSPG